MIISKAAVLAIALFCPSNAHDISKHGPFHASSSSTESKNNTNKNNAVASTSSLPLTLSLSPGEQDETRHNPRTYDEIGVLTNKPKSSFDDATSVSGEGHEDGLVSRYEDKLGDNPEARAFTNQILQDSEVALYGAQEDDENEDANVGILSFYQAGIEDNYQRYDNKEAAQRRLDLNPPGTRSCIAEGGLCSDCENAGGGSGKVTVVGDYSCTFGICSSGLEFATSPSCKGIGYGGEATIGNNSCSGGGSCSDAGRDGLATIGNESCTGLFSCFSTGSENGQVTIGTRSCNGERSCGFVGLGDGAVVEIGDDSCSEEESCYGSRRVLGISFTIGKNSCKCKECCKRLPDGSDIGDGQCNAISDGCSNQQEPVIRPLVSSCAALNKYSCELSLYMTDEDGGEDEQNADAVAGVSTKTAVCVKRTDTKKGKVEYRNECVSNEDILGLSSGSPLSSSSSSKPNVEEIIFSCGCCDPATIPEDEKEEEDSKNKSYKNNKIKYADSDWCVSNNGQGGPLCTPEDKSWDLCDEATTKSTKSKKKLLRHRDLGKKSRKGKSANKNDDKAYVNVCIRETVNGLETFSMECGDPFLDVRKVFGKGGGGASSATTVVASCGVCPEQDE